MENVGCTVHNFIDGCILNVHPVTVLIVGGLGLVGFCLLVSAALTVISITKDVLKK